MQAGWGEILQGLILEARLQGTIIHMDKKELDFIRLSRNQIHFPPFHLFFKTESRTLWIIYMINGFGCSVLATYFCQ